jgi:hypothetical protein
MFIKLLLNSPRLQTKRGLLLFQSFKNCGSSAAHIVAASYIKVKM